MLCLVKGCSLHQHSLLVPVTVVQTYTRCRMCPAACCKGLEFWCSRQADHLAILLMPFQMYMLSCSSGTKMVIWSVTWRNKASPKNHFQQQCPCLINCCLYGSTNNQNGCRWNRCCILIWSLLRFCKRNINSTLMVAITIMNVTAGTSSWAYVSIWYFSCTVWGASVHLQSLSHFSCLRILFSVSLGLWRKDGDCCCKYVTSQEVIHTLRKRQQSK